MQDKHSPDRKTFGLLPEPERSLGSFIGSIVVNGLILAVLLYIGATAKQVIEAHKYEMTELVVPTTPKPPEKVKLPPPPKVKLPEPPKLDVKLDAPKIKMPKLEQAGTEAHPD